MRFEDTITIQTPEGVDLELTLAGLGSRFVAGLVDGVLKIAVIIVASIPSAVASVTLLDALLAILGFVVWYGYDIAFEVFASGKTPGKRWSGIRVVRVGGQPVGFVASAVRNIIRIVDVFFFGIGMVVILLTSKNQRLGDLAAGTLVVRELRVRARQAPAQESFAARDELGAWDVSAVTTDEVAAVRQFLHRRSDLGDEARGRLAHQFAAALKPKVAGPVEDLKSEDFLERLVAAKSSR